MALNVVVAEPPGTVIVGPGTGSNGLLLESDTGVPPAALGPLSVTVQLVLPELPNVVGLQEKDVIVGTAGPDPVTVPPIAEMARGVPKFEAAWAFTSPIDVLVAPEAIVRFTIATVPF